MPLKTTRTRRVGHKPRAIVALLTALCATSLAACSATESTGSATQVKEPGASATSDSSGSGTQSSSTKTTEGTIQDDAADAAATQLPDFTLEASSSAEFPNAQSQLIPVKVRYGKHDDYERIVVEYQGSDTPEPQWSTQGWQTEIFDDGRGERIDLNAQRYLQIVVAGTAYPEADFDAKQLEVTLSAGAKLKGVRVDPGFEGMHLINLGLDADAPFRVFYLKNPARVVVDLLVVDLQTSAN